MNTILRRAALGMVTVLVLTACSDLLDLLDDEEPAAEAADQEPDEELAEEPAADEEPAEEATPAPAATQPAHQHVQDLWVYERIITIDSDGEEVELATAIVDGLAGTPDDEVELLDDVTFYVFDELAPTVVDSGGTVRDDLDVTAGLIEHDGDRALAVLATPHEDADASVRFGDEVSFDLTFLGELLAPDDPMLFDFAFLQAYPGEAADEEADLHGLELLAARMADERVGYFGQVVDGEPEVLLYTDQLGRATEGSTHGNGPAKAGDMRDGMTSGLRGCGGGLRCVARFFDRFGEGAKSSFDQALDNGGLTPSTPREPRHPTCRGARCSRSWGEPHLTTFDGANYDMQAVGEFVAASTDGFEVQLRTQPWGSSTTISIGTAVAVGYDQHRITVDIEADRDEIVRLDGEPVPIDDLRGEPIDLGDASVALHGDALQVELGDDLVTISNLEGRGFIDLYLDLGDESTGSAGLLGLGNGDPDDEFTTRDGEVLERPVSSDDLYEVFVASWRISQDESLFDYPSGTDTEHYTDLSLPTQTLTVDDLDPGAVARAQVVCEAADIQDEHVLQACIFDYALTGEVDFVRSAASAGVAEMIRIGQLDPNAMPLGGGAAPQIAEELSVGPYEPGPDELVWQFTSEDGTPDLVPDGIEASAIRDPNELPRFQLTDRYDYPTSPILRLSPHEQAASAAEAIEGDEYVEFDLTPTAGPVTISQVTLSAGQGRSDRSPRGFDLRSSADGYTTSLLSHDLEHSRPDMARFSAGVTGLTIDGPTTFRLYIYTRGSSRTVEIGDLAIAIDR